jgi:phosphoglycolate phosphatase-like HAD superfamily hydrolase
MPRSSAARLRGRQGNIGNLLGTSVIFDFDGVLIDSRFAVSHCMNRALAAHGLPERAPEELYRYIGPPTSIAFADLLGEPQEAPLSPRSSAATASATARRRWRTPASSTGSPRP